MKGIPPITVLMPAYNAEKYIREAIESILNQSFTDFEFLIINDGSTDQTETIVRSYSDSRIKLINQKNGGVSSALNTGLAQAVGKYIARFDADDICYANRIEEQYRFMLAHPDYVLIGSDADYVSETGDFIFAYESPGYTNEEIQERIFDRNPFIHSVVFFPKAAILECGGYDLKAHTFEDHLLWVKLLKKGKVCNFKKSFIKVRLNPASVTTDERLRGKRFLELRRKILESGYPISDEDELEMLSIIKSQNSARMKDLGYHLFVSKKYLWNNYKPQEARKHILAALRLSPFQRSTYLLLGISFLPKRIVLGLYKSLK